MDERLPSLHLELLEMCQEIVSRWCFYLEIRPPPWKFVSFLRLLQFCLAWSPSITRNDLFFPSALMLFCRNERSDRKGFLLSSSFRKTFFDLTLTLFNGRWIFLKNIFIISLKQLYSILWHVFCLLRRAHKERQVSWHSPTLTILWIRKPSWIESFYVFFPESHRYLRS